MSGGPILTDGQGRPFDPPAREDFEDVVDYIRARHTYNDRVRACGNKAFDEAFRKAMRGDRR